MTQHLLRGLTAALLLLPAASAQDRFAFPLRPAATDRTRGMELTLQPEAFAALADREQVLMDAVPLPGQGEAVLNLRRVRVTTPDSVVMVDGVAHPMSEVESFLNMWTGTVVGDEGSFAFLAFSPFGSRGVIRSGGEMWHLRSGQVVQGSPQGADAFLLGTPPDSDLGMAQAACGSMEVDQPLYNPNRSQFSAPPGGGPPDVGMSFGTYYQADIAVETDWQFYQLFNDVDAATTYVLTVFAAASSIYERDTGTVFNIPYVGIHSNAGDPWSAPDGGGSTISLLYEFRDAWSGGSAPVSADLYHFMSGASLGGGVAYIDVLCSQYYGFGVSANINGGLTLPITGPAPWDLVVVAHELGHNFSTPHTHDYCPPIDECPSASYWGSCQDERLCIADGTIMSYCHTCPGGLSNIDLEFDTLVAGTIRSAVVSSCLETVTLTDSLCLDPDDGVHVEIDPLESVTADATVDITACDLLGDPVDWTATFQSAAPWLTVSSMTGTATASATELTLSYDATGLAVGLHDTTLRFSTDADPGDYIELPVTLLVVAPPFTPGDVLTGTLASSSDEDFASFDGLSGSWLKLNVKHITGSSALTVSVLDGQAQEVYSFNVQPGKAKKKKVKLRSSETHLIQVTGEAGSEFRIVTRATYPANALPFKTRVKREDGGGYADIGIKLTEDATLNVAVTPKAGAGPLTISLYDPADQTVDLGGYLMPGGLAIGGLTAAETGRYRLRVSGFQTAKEKAKVKVTPTQPKGTETTVID